MVILALRKQSGRQSSMPAGALEQQQKTPPFCMSISISYHSMISNSSFATSYLLCKIFKNCLNWFNFMCRSVLLKLLKTRKAPLSTLVTLSFPQISWILSANHSGSKSSAVSSLTSIVWYYILEPIILHADLFAEVGEGIREEKLGTTFFLSSHVY